MMHRVKGSAEPRRDRQVVGPGELEATGDFEREELARHLESREPAAALWVSVVSRALDDFAYLRDKAGRPGLQRYERKRLQEIREHDPMAFFASRWFEEICDYLGLDPDAVRPPKEERLRVATIPA